MKDSCNPFVDTSLKIPTFAEGTLEHPSVLFYRKPLTQEQVESVLAKQASLKGGELLAHMRHRILEIVASWSFKAGADMFAPTLEDVTRLKHQLLTKIYLRAVTAVQTDPIPVEWLDEAGDDAETQAGKS
jgi:hypothetical protein